MAYNITITLTPPLGIGLGPNFNISTNVGSVVPNTATKDELLNGVILTIDDNATFVTVTSVGECVNSITQVIPCGTTTTTTTSTSTTTSTTTTTTLAPDCICYEVVVTSPPPEEGFAAEITYFNCFGVNENRVFGTTGTYYQCAQQIDGVPQIEFTFGEGTITLVSSCNAGPCPPETTTTSTTTTSTTSTSTTTSTTTTTTLAPDCICYEVVVTSPPPPEGFAAEITYLNCFGVNENRVFATTGTYYQCAQKVGGVDQISFTFGTGTITLVSSCNTGPCPPETTTTSTTSTSTTTSSTTTTTEPTTTTSTTSTSTTTTTEPTTTTTTTTAAPCLCYYIQNETAGTLFYEYIDCVSGYLNVPLAGGGIVRVCSSDYPSGVGLTIVPCTDITNCNTSEDCTGCSFGPTTTTTTSTTTSTTTTTTEAPTTTTTTEAPTTTSTTTTTEAPPAYNYYTLTPCSGGTGTDYRSILALGLFEVYAFLDSPPARACYTVTSISAPVNTNDLPTLYGPKIGCEDTDCVQV